MVHRPPFSISKVHTWTIFNASLWRRGLTRCGYLIHRLVSIPPLMDDCCMGHRLPTFPVGIILPTNHHHQGRRNQEPKDKKSTTLDATTRNDIHCWSIFGSIIGLWMQHYWMRKYVRNSRHHGKKMALAHHRRHHHHHHHHSFGIPRWTCPNQLLLPRR